MDGASARAGVAGSKPSRTSIGRHSGRLPRAEVRSNDLYSNRASGGETGGKDMELSRERGAAASLIAVRVKLAPQEGSERTNEWWRPSCTLTAHTRHGTVSSHRRMTNGDEYGAHAPEEEPPSTQWRAAPARQAQGSRLHRPARRRQWHCEFRCTPPCWLGHCRTTRAAPLERAIPHVWLRGRQHKPRHFGTHHLGL